MKKFNFNPLFLIVFFFAIESFAQVSSATLNSKDYKNFLLGKFNPDSSEFFVLIPSMYTRKSGIFIQKETLEAYIKMFVAAKKDGVNLEIISATRSFIYQKGIWERKWNSPAFQKIMDAVSRARQIMHYSAMPGTSRHHWGTDIDLNSLSNNTFSNGNGKLVYEWLLKNAGKFGFCQVYSERGQNRKFGYEEEKWHWSYLPLAQSYTKDYPILIKKEDIGGFSGCESFEMHSVIHHFVLGINPSCK